MSGGCSGMTCPGRPLSSPHTPCSRHLIIMRTWDPAPPTPARAHGTLPPPLQHVHMGPCPPPLQHVHMGPCPPHSSTCTWDPAPPTPTWAGEGSALCLTLCKHSSAVCGYNINTEVVPCIKYV